MLTVVQLFSDFFPLSYQVFEMNRGVGFTVVLLTFGFAPLVIAGPIWSKEVAETQGFKDLLKTVGSNRMLEYHA